MVFFLLANTYSSSCSKYVWILGIKHMFSRYSGHNSGCFGVFYSLLSCSLGYKQDSG